ncbi:MAG: glycosyltransferase family 2 protein [Herpetosiphon sp.]
MQEVIAPPSESHVAPDRAEGRMETTTPTLSIVAPVYNEAAGLNEFVLRLTTELQQLGESYEIILINDGSRDASLEVMRELHRADPHVKILSFSKNFGHQLAITAGADYARGHAVIVIDSDLQDPPEAIRLLVAKWREGFELVYAVRESREGETLFKKATARFFYRLIRSVTNVDIPVDTGDFRLMDRKVVDALNQVREHHRFMRGLSIWVGFKQTGVLYRRQPRFAGQTNYPLGKMVKLALTGITSFSYLPLQLATYLGFMISGLSLLFIVMVVILRLSRSSAFAGQATTLVSVLFLGGIQLISLGVIGEYLGRIYDEVKHRPLYILAEKLGLEAPVPSSRGPQH